MNNQKPFLLAGSIILWIIALTLVFMAGRMSGWFDRFDGRAMRRNDMMRGFDVKGNFGGMRGERGMNREMQFIDESSLTADQKTQLEKIRDDQQQKMQDLMQSFRTWSGTSQTEIESQIETLWKAHMAEIRPFVAQDQLDEFDAFVAEGKPQMPRMMGGKGRGMW